MVSLLEAETSLETGQTCQPEDRAELAWEESPLPVGQPERLDSGPLIDQLVKLGSTMAVVPSLPVLSSFRQSDSLERVNSKYSDHRMTGQVEQDPAAQS